jgi:hypothetical protein
VFSFARANSNPAGEKSMSPGPGQLPDVAPDAVRVLKKDTLGENCVRYRCSFFSVLRLFGISLKFALVCTQKNQILKE